MTNITEYYSERSKELTQELSNEFKNAAKSIATLYNSSNDSCKTDFTNAAKSVSLLYKKSNNSREMVYNHGYSACLDDLFQVIQQQGDVENWVLTKRAEFIKNQERQETKENHIDKKPIIETKDIPETEEEQVIPKDIQDTISQYNFTFSSDLKPSVHFRPSIPPLSVQHNLNQRTAKRLDKIHRIKPSTTAAEDLQMEKLTLQLKCESSPPKKKKKI
ncbi:hypothetical protein JA1_001069 [Spathaspora sp. JA1]|nr:hypothetical protein JA1_001069 [Spathaspora sp. JA1]